MRPLGAHQKTAAENRQLFPIHASAAQGHSFTGKPPGRNAERKSVTRRFRFQTPRAGLLTRGHGSGPLHGFPLVSDSCGLLTVTASFRTYTGFPFHPHLRGHLQGVIFTHGFYNRAVRLSTLFWHHLQNTAISINLSRFLLFYFTHFRFAIFYVFGVFLTYFSFIPEVLFVVRQNPVSQKRTAAMLF